jgi:thermitase
MHRAVLAALAATLVLAAPAAAADVNTVIVKYADGATAAKRTAAADRAGLTSRVGRITGANAQVVRVSGDAAAAASRLNRSVAVDYAEPNAPMRALATPNDTLFGQLYGIHNTGQSGGLADADLDGPEGWDLAGLGGFPATGGVKVGIVDTGVNQSHEDLTGKTVNCASANVLTGAVAEGSCADDNDHGSHVSGTIAGIANNGRGVAGVAFNSQLAHCKALHGPLGMGSTAGVANCITYLHSRGAKVISMSLGGGASTTLQTAVANAWQNGNGAVLVAAAGNDGDATLNYPAAYAQVISVAATDRNDARASFSNENADVEIAAAGVDVVSTVRSGYAAFSGTSMATPHVSAVAALVWGKNPAFTAAQVRSKLDASVDDLGPAGRDASFGFGRVNLVKAMS